MSSVMSNGTLQTECNNLREIIGTVKASYFGLSNKYNELLTEIDLLRKKNSEFGQIKAKNVQLLSQVDQTKTSHTSELIEDCNKITLNDNKMKSEYKTQIKQLQERESKMKSEYEAHVKRLQGRNNKMKSVYEEHINQLQEEANDYAKKQNQLDDEASGYQAALGSATNVKGKSIKIDEIAAKHLLTQYECKVSLNSKEIKNCSAANLQRMILERFVNYFVNKMEKYREVVDEERKKALHSEKIIRTGIQLWFCLKAQEPLPKIHWFKSGAHIETHLMDSQVINKAQVFIRPKQNRKFQKLKDFFEISHM
ncbi:hypothetical protein RhiirA4_482121 [Rhizophagus irregularis]|uniref:Uncharacterized protein n=1 Tax=Rhizophagus irregularis TaxID=588596 RepID=A0A2I1HKN8_9GLOM|nr:hypothetical protein RhiirA4_482109 [Rhizophagus irregularis]PKY59400.1 hypothetical protein RhiirA4_482121 [Rhizophagus irregularis]